MGNRFKLFSYIVIGAIGGLFIGGTLGELLGAGAGAIIGLMEFGEIQGSQLILTGGLLGLAFGSILGSGLLSLGRVVSGTAKSLVLQTLICSFIGLAAGTLYSTFPAGSIASAEFMIFGGSVGVWTGIATGGFVGTQTALRASRDRVIVSEAEKKSNSDYARFMKERAGPK